MTITMLAPKRGVTVHASALTRAGRLAVRDATPEDVDAYVNYWHYSGEEIKDLIGIDRKKLGSPEDSRKRFLNMVRVPGTEQANVVFTVTLDDEVIGYSNLNRYGPDDNYAHLHTYRNYVRSLLKTKKSAKDAKTGTGLGGAVIGLIGGYFSLFAINRVVLQTRTTNRNINAVLDLYLPPAETKYVEQPAGLLAPGEMYVRYVYRKDVAWIRTHAETLRGLDGHRRAALQPGRPKGVMVPMG